MTKIYRTHRAVILGLTRMGFVLGWRFLMASGLGFKSIVMGVDFLSAARSSTFTAREAVSVLEGLSGIETDIEPLDGGIIAVGMSPEVEEEVEESTEVVGTFLAIGLGRGFKTRLELYQ